LIRFDTDKKAQKAYFSYFAKKEPKIDFSGLLFMG
jgi:hypothetical protein